MNYSVWWAPEFNTIINSPVQRQMFPSKLSSTCCLVGLGFSFNKLPKTNKQKCSACDWTAEFLLPGLRHGLQWKQSEFLLQIRIICCLTYYTRSYHKWGTSCKHLLIFNFPINSLLLHKTVLSQSSKRKCETHFSNTTCICIFLWLVPVTKNIL